MPSSEVFHKYGAGKLHSGSKKGPVVKNHAQAVAIFLSEKRKEGQHGGKYPERKGYEFGGTPTMPCAPGLMHHAQEQSFPGHFGLNPAQSGFGGLGAGQGLFNSLFGQHMAPQAQQGPEGAMGQPRALGMRADGGNVIRMPGAATPQGRVFNALSTDDLNKLTTNRTLMNALGGGAKVLPFTPDDGKAAGGGLGAGYAYGGSPTSMGLTPGWIERQEARNISHTGPIISAVGGRTDHHSINVPSGSYVLPAAHVSAMGQGNTLNGMKILQGMFGPPMKMAHGAGPPRMHAPGSLMPKTSGLGMSSSGGSRGDNTGRPVPIFAAGGEYVLGPEQVARVGRGDIDLGHRILDHWVKKTHKKAAKTIANLPPPAKS